ncbi:Fur family transcriptional regulator [Georgenia thermotolerans]|uniref:Transcriptional repressor n=1 Tax=Georgenia thermotolerans TaxID=527326 RepID=A0A7J5US67_9MICO|nr:Fur family transcriptional regulator [Georgenia thermotolerans]KAE8764673.1 transcriptional repressor [Georgenia thermotolerans]
MVATYPELLRQARLRVTAPRLAVLEEVAAHPHADAETVRAGVLARLGSVSTQAIYDVLGALTTAGILRRIEPEGSPGRYELRRGDNHHHLVCRGCGRVEDVACAVGAAPCLHASEDHGFVIDTAEVIYWGTCPSCLSRSTPTKELS